MQPKYRVIVLSPRDHRGSLCFCGNTNSNACYLLFLEVVACHFLVDGRERLFLSSIIVVRTAGILGDHGGIVR